MTINMEGNNYRIDSERGKVSYLMRAGTDMVRAVMSEAGAMSVIREGVVSVSDVFPGYPICVNDKFFFAGALEDDSTPETPTPRKKRRR